MFSVACGFAPSAWADNAPRLRLTLTPQSRSDALIELALKFGVSIGGVSNCPGRAPALSGTFTLQEALDRVTAGACGFEIIAPRAVRVSGARRPAPAPVRPPPAPAPSVVSEVLVTATKRVEDANRLPASISAIGADQLETAGVKDAAGMVRLAAGMTTTNLGAGRDKIMLRGISDGAFTGRTRSTVGIFLDNAPLTYNAPDPDLRLVDVETVEVIRGPQGALYGAGSISGVYRIVTRKPDLDSFQTKIGALAGWTQSGSPSTTLEAMVNAPLAEGRLAARLVAYHDVEGGYLDDVNLRLSNVDQTTRVGGRLAVKAWLSPEWTLTVSGAVQQLDSNDTQYVTASQVGLRRANRVRETHGNDFAQAGLTLEGATPWGRLQSSTAYVRHAFASQYDASAALSLFGASAADLGVYVERAKIDMVVQDTVLTSTSAGRYRWLVGAYGSISDEESPSDLAVAGAVGAPRDVYAETRADRMSELAAYGEVSVDLGAGWGLAFGGRGSRISRRTSSDIVVDVPGGQSRAFIRKAEFSNWSPKISLQYVFSSGNLVYGLATEGYRAGGFNSGGLVTPGPARRAYRPDRLRNYEIGAKLSLADQRLDLRSALFYDLWDDIQSDQYFPSGLPFTANVGDGRNVGLEVEAFWRPTPRWTLQANGLFDDPKITRADPAFASRIQKQLPGVPDVSFSALVTYERPLADGLTLLLTGQASYVGRSRLTFDPALSPVMGGYYTSRLSAQLRSARWRLAAFLDNPTNAQADTFAYGNPFSFGQVRQVTPQRPRTLNLVITRTF